MPTAPLYDVIICWNFVRGGKVPRQYEIVTVGMRPRCPHMVVAEKVTREEAERLGQHAYELAMAEAPHEEETGSAQVTSTERAIDSVTLIEVQPTQRLAFARFASNETWHVLRNVDHRTFAHYIRDEQTLHVRIKDFTDDKLDLFSKQASDAQIVHWYVIRLAIEAARKDGLDILAIRGTENVHAY